MAETVRDVLIRFRVEGPRSSGGGSPAVGGLSIGGSSASASSVNRGGAGAENDLPTVMKELTDAIKGLTLALRFQGFSNIATSGVNLVGAGTLANAAGISAGLGGLGSRAGALGGRMLAIGQQAAPYALGAAAAVGAAYVVREGLRSGSRMAGVGEGLFDPSGSNAVERAFSQAEAIGRIPGQVRGLPERYREFIRGNVNRGANILGGLIGEDSGVFQFLNRHMGFEVGPTVGEQRSADPDISFRNQARRNALSMGRERGSLAASRFSLERLGQQFDTFQGINTFAGAQAAGNRRLEILRGNIADRREMLPSMRLGGETGSFEGAVGEAIPVLKGLMQDRIAEGRLLVDMERQKLDLARQTVATLTGSAMSAFMMPGIVRQASMIQGKLARNETLSRSDVFKITQTPIGTQLSRDEMQDFKDTILTQTLRDVPGFREAHGKQLATLPPGVAPTSKAIEDYMADTSKWESDSLGELKGIREEIKTLAQALSTAQEEALNIGKLEVSADVINIHKTRAAK